MKASFVTAAILVLAGSNVAAGAQSDKTIEAFTRGPFTAPAEQAIAGITTRFLDKQGQVIEERHGCGMVLRSDGFVLFSAAMLDHRGDEPEDIRPMIEVTLQPGLPDERKVKAPWPKSIPTNVSLRMVKLAEVSAPALRTLLLDKVKPGDELTVAWQTWNESAHRFDARVGHPYRLAQTTKKSTAPWLEAFTEPVEGVPPGALVLGPDGMAVGMVPVRSGEDHRLFVSMEALPKITNCVTPVPTPDADFSPAPPAAEPVDLAVAPAAGAPEQGPAAPKGAMVKVPGGPVVLPKGIAATQLEMDKATVACVAPFQIDRLQVTNQEYWDYWKGLPEKTSAEQAFKRLARPIGWAGPEEPFGDDLARLPVLGVSYPGALGYARAHGKRLPTPYEWALAALGPLGDQKAPEWMIQYVNDTNEAALRIKKAHKAFLEQYQEIHGEDFLKNSERLHSLSVTKVKVGRAWLTVSADQRIHGTDFMVGLPWIICPLLGFAPELQGGYFDALNGVAGFDMPLRLKMQVWSKALVQAETQPLRDRWKEPLSILPVGSRSFDTSTYGAQDMVFNGAELVAPPAAAPSGQFGFAVGVTMVHPQDKQVWDDLLLLTGVDTTGTVESYPSTVAYPVTRLIDRSVGFPVAQWLWFNHNVEAARAAMRVISGFQVNMQPAASTVEIRTDNHTPFLGPVFYDNYPLYRDWVKPPARLHQEIASALPLPAEERLPTVLVPRESGAWLRFLVPIGFRCAR